MNREQYTLTDTQASKDLAIKIASRLKGGDIITLSGDLGSGKTYICREIIKALCGEDTIVPSPSFNLVQIYQAKDWRIYHYDFYRLKSVEEIWELGIEEALSGNICLIEWPEVADKILPFLRTEMELSWDGEVRRCIIQYRETEAS
ncbi:MAG: tRNA (adenosine(37)-N6)-threonylcarbamoyltransferase complex ATPase subunit type 1 TsaE [Pseudomonadota bacterium]